MTQHKYLDDNDIISKTQFRLFEYVKIKLYPDKTLFYKSKLNYYITLFNEIDNVFIDSLGFIKERFFLSEVNYYSEYEVSLDMIGDVINKVDIYLPYTEDMDLPF